MNTIQACVPFYRQQVVKQFEKQLNEPHVQPSQPPNRMQTLASQTRLNNPLSFERQVEALLKQTHPGAPFSATLLMNTYMNQRIQQRCFEVVSKTLSHTSSLNSPLSEKATTIAQDLHGRLCQDFPTQAIPTIEKLNDLSEQILLQEIKEQIFVLMPTLIDQYALSCVQECTTSQFTLSLNTMSSHLAAILSEQFPGCDFSYFLSIEPIQELVKAKQRELQWVIKELKAPLTRELQKITQIIQTTKESPSSASILQGFYEMMDLKRQQTPNPLSTKHYENYREVIGKQIEQELESARSLSATPAMDPLSHLASPPPSPKLPRSDELDELIKTFTEEKLQESDAYLIPKDKGVLIRDLFLKKIFQKWKAYKMEAFEKYMKAIPEGKEESRLDLIYKELEQNEKRKKTQTQRGSELPPPSEECRIRIPIPPSHLQQQPIITPAFDRRQQPAPPKKTLSPEEPRLNLSAPQFQMAEPSGSERRSPKNFFLETTQIH